LELTEKCREWNSTIYNKTQKYVENYRSLKISQGGFRLGYDDVYFCIDWYQRFGGSCWFHLQFVGLFFHKNKGGSRCVKDVVNYKIINQNIPEGSDLNVKNKSLNYKINAFKLINTFLVEVLLLSYIRTHATPLQQRCLQTFKCECKITHGFSPVYSSHNKVSPALPYFTDKCILCHPSISTYNKNKNNNNYYYYYIY